MTRSAEVRHLSLDILARSRKPNEHRLPIHPAHFVKIDHQIRRRIFVEYGYGAEFWSTDDALAEFVGGVRTRDQLIAHCEVILLPKVQADDLAELGAGQVAWGWPRCVQDVALTQTAIDPRLTLIAFEAMNHWQADGGFDLHDFHKNNELAGYCSVIHAMQLAGITGSYGRRLRASVIGFGATARGAVTALNAHCVDDVRVLTNRDVAAVGLPIHSTQIIQMGRDDDAPNRTWADTPDAGIVPVARAFVTEEDLSTFPPGSLIVDVSCDEGMGFSWAHPTTFIEPVVELANGVQYYAVDHSPSYLWNSATWEISEALLPHIETLLRRGIRPRRSAGPSRFATVSS